MMSNEKPNFVSAKLTMPDGKEHEVLLPAKTFSTGRTGFYAQIPSMAYDNDVYGGQIQIWKKSDNKDRQ